MKTEPSEQLITRAADPVNLEMPFSSLRDVITPNELFYVRCHLPIPKIEVAGWRLQVEGLVANSLELSLDEIRQLPHQTVTATMECAGNGRSYLAPKVKGVQWDIGAVGNVVWRGVWLRDVLERAGLQAHATTIVLEGADRGEIKEPPRPPGKIRYARSLPRAKATDNVLLAFEMNGEPISTEHGFPLRAVVPGWFGMASVKWLQRIIATDRPFGGYYETLDYTYWETIDGNEQLIPLAEMRVKAQIARPLPDEVLLSGSTVRVQGAAWAGENAVAKVELSTDGGATWNEATLSGEATKYAWRFWEYEWQTPSAPAKHELIARAFDVAGNGQPPERVPGYGSYMVNHWLRVPVEVR